MLVFSDFHHSGAAQGQALLFHRRLGHNLYFPNEDFVRRCIEVGWSKPGDILPCLPTWLRRMGGYPEYREKDWEYVLGYDEFLSRDWDAILVTRIETQTVFKELRKLHPHGSKIKFIGVTGNDNTPFDWELVPNLLSSDYPTFVNSPPSIHKLWYSQEIGHNYFDAAFTPVEGLARYTVNQFVNCWPTMRGPWHKVYDMSNWHSRCPFCGADQRGAPLGEVVDPYGIWCGAKALLPTHWFQEYGIGCEHGCVEEVNLPSKYVSGALTVHFKAYEGYGFSMLQSILCGRPVIVPREFYRYRTAGKYLIPNLTCFVSDWDAKSLADVIGYVTGSVERVNRYAKACYATARGLFDFNLEAFRVEEFMEELR